MNLKGSAWNPLNPKSLREPKPQQVILFRKRLLVEDTYRIRNKIKFFGCSWSREGVGGEPRPWRVSHIRCTHIFEGKTEVEVKLKATCASVPQ